MCSRTFTRTLSRTDSLPRTGSRPLPGPQFAFPRAAPRSTQPEVFTFERIPAQVSAVRSYVPIRPRKRCTRVMYPAKVRMHLPPPEKSQAQRWLLVLVLVLLWQIYTEEPCADPPLSSECQGFSLQAPEELARIQPGSELESAPRDPQHVVPGSSCPRPGQEPESSRALEQSSAGNSYVVALLVYHRLGGDS
ncbi:radiation-inducible immediate-early gene IEX-1 [Limanda limanda]|uniref:radiation-inducible immediate-early gene IEX-1 n=1 Tax=Limanda limanda TaxID=27771 RepID=UPI0029C64440|nr:radiation-inducible immediate-early gene IEX-1 [Limanda limanda]